MFNLFMLLRGDANEITNASLIDDIKAKFPLASEFNIFEKTLVMPRTTVIEMEREDSSIRISIRPDDNMTIDLGYYAPLIGKDEPLPEDFLDYNIEIAIGFWDNPEGEHSDDVIFMSEFFKTNYPGIVIFDWNKNRW